MPLNATTARFDEVVLESDLPVLVDFWAPWCGPCRQVAPHLDRLAEDEADTLKVVKVNVDDEPEIAARYGITGIPTFIVFRDGEPVTQRSGALPYAALKALVSA